MMLASYFTSSHHNKRPRRAEMTGRAFTLIELLVVIAIISLLVSILLPSLSRAKELARRAVCMANIRSFGASLQIYVSSAQVIPPHAEDHLAREGQRMPNLGDMVAGGYYGSLDGLICPTAPDLYPYKYKADTRISDKDQTYWSGFWNTRLPVTGPTFTGAKWTYNNNGYNAPMGTYYYFGGGVAKIEEYSSGKWNSHDVDGGAARKWFDLRPNQIASMSSYAILWDQDWRRLMQGGMPFPPPSPHMREGMQGRSILFMDGHVEWLSDDNEMVKSCDASILNSMRQFAGIEHLSPIILLRGVHIAPNATKHDTNYYTPSQSEYYDHVLKIRQPN